jgi:Heavy metal associated domain 2
MNLNIAVKGAVAFAPINVLPVNGLPALRAQVAHHIPGRLRLRSALLKDNPRVAEEATRRLADIEGVTSATANPSTGGLLLSYDPGMLPPRDLLELLADQAHISALDQTPAAAGGDWIDKLANVIKGWFLDAVTEHLALAVIGALI